MKYSCQRHSFSERNFLGNLFSKKGDRQIGRGFTLIELIFVIVIIGILSAVLAPRFNRPTLTEAANQLVSHIRYTQHLAMVDDKFNSTRPTWFKERWQLRFHRSVDSKEVWTYSIFSDKGLHDKNPNVSNQEVARDPLNPGTVNSSGQLINGQYLTGGFSGGSVGLNNKRRNKNMSLGEKYGVNWVSFTRSCSTGNPLTSNQSRRIIFDNIGRPYYNYLKDTNSMASNPYQNMDIIKNQCVISLCTERKCVGGDIIQIAIEPETGYTHIL